MPLFISTKMKKTRKKRIEPAVDFTSFSMHLLCVCPPKNKPSFSTAPNCRQKAILPPKGGNSPFRK